MHTSTIDVFHAERRRALRRVAGRRLPEGHRVRALQAARPSGTGASPARQAGIELVIVNPAAVYGPGPSGSASIERDLLAAGGRGAARGCRRCRRAGSACCSARARATGICWWPSEGKPGERYILCDAARDAERAGRTAVQVAGRGKVPANPPGVRGQGDGRAVGEPVARLTRQARRCCRGGQLTSSAGTPRRTPARPDASCGWEPTSLEPGVRATIKLGRQRCLTRTRRYVGPPAGLTGHRPGCSTRARRNV